MFDSDSGWMITMQKYGHWWEQSSSGSIARKVSIGWWTRQATFQNMNQAVSVEGLMSLPYCWQQCRLQSLVSILEWLCVWHTIIYTKNLELLQQCQIFLFEVRQYFLCWWPSIHDPHSIWVSRNRKKERKHLTTFNLDRNVVWSQSIYLHSLVHVHLIYTFSYSFLSIL